MGVIGIVKNGAYAVESESTIIQMPQKGMKVYTIPIAFAPGDVLAFYICNVALQAPNGVPSANFNYFIHAVVKFDF